MDLAQIGEFGLIAQLQNDLETRAGTRLGIGDDCAVLETLHTPIVTLDALVENVHFRRDWTPPRALGRKAMAVSVSDLAASGARPVAAFVSLTTCPRDDVEFLTALYEGLEDAAREFGFTVAGGDTTRSASDLVLSITLIGEAINAQRGAVLRAGARSGDVLLVSGTLGDSAAGLAILQSNATHANAAPAGLTRPNDAPTDVAPTDATRADAARPNQISAATRAYLLQRHHEPTPRLELMKKLLEWDAAAIHAALDLSDGLVGDAAHLARRSGIALQIEAAQLPISAPCREAARFLNLDATELALSGGEDYELLLAVAPESAEMLLQKARDAGFALREIGKCAVLSADTDSVTVWENGALRPLKRAWTHF